MIARKFFFHELTYQSFLLAMQLTLLYSFTSPGLFVKSCWHLFAGRAWQPQAAVRGPGRVTCLRCAAIAAAWSALSACPCMGWSEQLPAQLPAQLLGLLLFGEICCAGGVAWQSSTCSCASAWRSYRMRRFGRVGVFPASAGARVSVYASPTKFFLILFALGALATSARSPCPI